MRKFTLITIFLLLCWWTSYPQAVFYSDDFESYAPGDYMGIVNPTWWTTWSNSPGTGEDCYVSDNFAYSGSNSVFLDPDDGLTDAILKLGDKTSGAWELDWMMYVETGYTGYYNIQHFEVPGTEWAIEVYFNDGGTGELDVGGDAIPFTFPQDTWFSVKHLINIDADMATLTVNDVEVYSWPFHYESNATDGTNQLGGVDFYTDDATHRYYIDDLMYEQVLVPFYEDDFEDYMVGDYMGIVRPEWWTTWSNSPGTGEDSYVSDNFAMSGTQSVFIDPDDGLTDAILKLGDKTSGSYEVDWNMYIESGYQAYYNFQHFEVPGTEWAFEVYFNDGAAGELDVGNESFSFSFPYDTWFPVKHVINVEGDTAFLYVNNVMVHSWPFHYEASSTDGTNQLGGIDFYTDDATYRYYLDDVVYKPVPIDWYIDDFDSYTVGDYMGIIRPEWWTTWSNSPGTGEDCYVSDNYANSPTQSVFIDPDDGLTDAIFKFGDKTSGAYIVQWDMYIESDYQAYYNFQHFETPGTEWAFEIYFNDGGAGELDVGNETFAFTFPYDTWFTVTHTINIDGDLATLTVDDMDVHSWPFHYEASSTDGTNQLGGIDFYTDDATYRYYIDNMSFIQTINSELIPMVNISPGSLLATTPQGTTTTKNLMVGNSGGADLDYNFVVLYDVAQASTPIPQPVPSDFDIESLGELVPSVDPNAKPASYNPAAERDSVVLHYDGDNANSYSWGPNAPYTITNAAMFPSTMVSPYLGMMITSVDIYIGTGGTNFSLRVYDMGTMDSPGTLLVDQAFTQTDESWNHVVLDEPVTINGGDVWVGYQYTQPDTSLYIAGADAGPADPLGGFLTFNGQAWVKLTDYGADANWNIRANVTGTPMFAWLTFNQYMGTVAPGETDTLTGTFDADNLAVGIYHASLHFTTNDPNVPSMDVPASLAVTPGVGIPESQSGARITIYPNPASDNFRILSDQEMNEVEIYNQLGQMVYNQTIKNKVIDFNTTGLQKGVYFVRVKYAQGSSLQKLVIK